MTKTGLFPTVRYFFVLLIVPLAAGAQGKPRARDLGVPFEGLPRHLNAITDVAGVEVGQTTLISGEGALRVGSGPVRASVTVVLPRGRRSGDDVFAGWFSLNGNGEMTGTAWVEESGFLDGPIVITNTHSVGVARDAVIAWRVKHETSSLPANWWSLPVVAETWDGWLNDINGFHVKPEHIFQTLDEAKSGPVAEGGVGGGTGMICYEFKGGIGTASRKLSDQAGGFTVGVLVQANHGRRSQLKIAGVPVGLEITCDAAYGESSGAPAAEARSIIITATDAPLLSHQLKCLARRSAMGLARTSSISGNGSGDTFLAFSTANPGAALASDLRPLTMLPNDRMDPLFEVAVQDVEEAIVNALVAGETMMGADGHRVIGLPHDALRRTLKKYSRLEDKVSLDR